MAGEATADVAIVGAGLGGLALAALCARGGLKVFVCERNHYPGGYACDFGRKGTRFDASLHSIGGCGPGGMTREVLDRCGVAGDLEVVPLPTFYRAIFPDLDIRVPSDPRAYLDVLASHFPSERDSIARVFADWAGILRELSRFDGSRIPNFLRAFLFPLLSPRTLRAANQTLAQALERRVRDPRLRTVLAQLWVYMGLPPDRLSALAFAPAWASYHSQGTYHLGATAASLSAALAATVEKHGGTIRYRAPAEALLFEGRRAAGVRMEGGEAVRARCVASNADARTTFLKLVGRERLPPRFVARLEAMRPSISCVQVYASWEEDLRSSGLTDHMIFVNTSWDSAAEWEATLRGDFEKAGFGITVYTNMDPKTPAGTGSVAALTCLAPYDLPGGWGDVEGRRGRAYGDLKRTLGDQLVARAARIAPAIATPTRTRDVATPLTLERYTGNTAGAMYGWENSPDQSGLRRLRRHPVKGLHLVGHWTFPSSGYTGVLKSAEFQAARILAGFGRSLPEGKDGP